LGVALDAVISLKLVTLRPYGVRSRMTGTFPYWLAVPRGAIDIRRQVDTITHRDADVASRTAFKGTLGFSAPGFAHTARSKPTRGGQQ